MTVNLTNRLRTKHNLTPKHACLQHRNSNVLQCPERFFAVTSVKPASITVLMSLLPRDKHLAAVLDAQHPEVELSPLQFARHTRAPSGARCSFQCSARPCSQQIGISIPPREM